MGHMIFSPGGALGATAAAAAQTAIRLVHAAVRARVGADQSSDQAKSDFMHLVRWLWVVAIISGEGGFKIKLSNDTQPQ